MDWGWGGEGNRISEAIAVQNGKVYTTRKNGHHHRRVFHKLQIKKTLKHNDFSLTQCKNTFTEIFKGNNSSLSVDLHATYSTGKIAIMTPIVTHTATDIF